MPGCRRALFGGCCGPESVTQGPTTARRSPRSRRYRSATRPRWSRARASFSCRRRSDRRSLPRAFSDLLVGVAVLLERVLRSGVIKSVEQVLPGGTIRTDEIGTDAVKVVTHDQAGESC